MEGSLLKADTALFYLKHTGLIGYREWLLNDPANMDRMLAYGA